MGKYWSVLIGLLFCAPTVYGEDPRPATFWKEGERVRFWQTDHLSGNQGTCVVKFTFDGAGLNKPLENLKLAIRVIDEKGIDLGVGHLVLGWPLGASGAGRYGEANFRGVRNWPLAEHGKPSPLCYKGTRLIVESAIGQQNNTKIDLVRFRQLEFTSFQPVNIQVGE